MKREGVTFSTYKTTCNWLLFAPPDSSVWLKESIKTWALREEVQVKQSFIFLINTEFSCIWSLQLLTGGMASPQLMKLLTSFLKMEEPRFSFLHFFLLFTLSPCLDLIQSSKTTDFPTVFTFLSSLFYLSIDLFAGLFVDFWSLELSSIWS